ncbi:alpha/beta hydrolase [Dehalococcoidia bacterium]|nr:alpha/beta hydrolase [Dehalococcoidia bacterium]
MSAAQSKFIEINGINMHYLEWGEIGAPDILLVHGWTGLGASWASVAASLENNYHIIAPDNRGHGKSSKPVTGYRLRDFTEDIHQLINSLSLQQPALVGHSWGGAIGITMAADHPYDISKGKFLTKYRLLLAIMPENQRVPG